jgi:hypothetical protein
MCTMNATWRRGALCPGCRVGVAVAIVVLTCEERTFRATSLHSAIRLRPPRLCLHPNFPSPNLISFADVANSAMETVFLVQLSSHILSGSKAVTRMMGKPDNHRFELFHVQTRIIQQPWRLDSSHAPHPTEDPKYPPRLSTPQTNHCRGTFVRSLAN